MVVDFFKMSGTGNDFIVLDNRQHQYKTTDTPVWVKICQRRTGIGADGVLLFNQAKDPKNDFSMSIINADGSVGEMCANGARCLLFFAHHILKLKSFSQYNFETLNGVYSGEVGEYEVKLRMTEIFDVQKIKLDGMGPFKHSFYVNTGVPHSLFEVKNLDHFNVYEEGKRIRHHPLFSKGCNVNFFERLGPRELKLRTFERGVEDETLSCGTGVTAAGIMAQKILGIENELVVKTRGGTLKVLFDKNLEHVHLCGPVEMVFIGKTQLEFR